MRRTFYLVLGCLGLALGAVGALVPLLPAFPFLVLAAFSFGKSSPRLHQWFLNSSLYKNNIEGFVSGRGMSKAAKIRVILTVTLVMGAGIYFMKRIPWGQIALGVIWLGHVIYFLFGIRTVER